MSDEGTYILNHDTYEKEKERERREKDDRLNENEQHYDLG